MATKKNTETVETGEMTRDQALRESYITATKALREAHKDEFNALRAEHAAALGFEWTPPLSEEEKARQQYEELLAKFPSLAQGSAV